MGHLQLAFIERWLHFRARGRPQSFSAILVPLGAREAGFLAALEKWLSYTVTILDRFRCNP